jgi:hypothetical protein
MRQRHAAIGVALISLVPALTLVTTAGAGGSAPAATPFPDARLKIEYNATDGDATLSHAVPDGPTIVSPPEDATVGPENLVVEWLPVTTPAGVDVVAYQVLVVADTPAVGNPTRVLDVMLPATVTRLPVPAALLVPGPYKTEVLAIERSGNQTLTEVAFTVG